MDAAIKCEAEDPATVRQAGPAADCKRARGLGFSAACFACITARTFFQEACKGARQQTFKSHSAKQFAVDFKKTA